MIENDFAVFILTHGRPKNVITYKTLKKQGYTGKIYIVVDNEDKTLGEYKELYGNEVIVFDKQDIANRYDTGDNFKEHRSVFFARNACFEIAQKLGITYFLELDDDYHTFDYTSLKHWRSPVKASLDLVFDAMLRYYKSIDAVTIAFGQGGDLIGGRQSTYGQKTTLKRKAINTFFCSTERPFEFVGRVNEDVNTYTSLGQRGILLLTMFGIVIRQTTTQANSGGMTWLYLNEGTYVKSFYTVMYAPSCAKISTMGDKRKRIHHKINWNNTTPMILDEKWKKSN